MLRPTTDVSAGGAREKEKDFQRMASPSNGSRRTEVKNYADSFLFPVPRFWLKVEGCRASLRTFQVSGRCVNFRFRYRSRFRFRFRFRPPLNPCKTSTVRRSHPLVFNPYADRNVRAPLFLSADRRTRPLVLSPKIPAETSAGRRSIRRDTHFFLYFLYGFFCPSVPFFTQDSCSSVFIRG